MKRSSALPLRALRDNLRLALGLLPHEGDDSDLPGQAAALNAQACALWACASKLNLITGACASMNLRAMTCTTFDEAEELAAQAVRAEAAARRFGALARQVQAQDWSAAGPEPMRVEVWQVRDELGRHDPARVRTIGTFSFASLPAAFGALSSSPARQNERLVRLANRPGCCTVLYVGEWTAIYGRAGWRWLAPWRRQNLLAVAADVTMPGSRTRPGGLDV